jgi:hypothetical protein
VIAEAVEHASAGVAHRRLAVLSLIEKQPGFLAMPQVHFVLHRPFAHRHGVGNLAGQHVHALLEPLERANLGVVARQDAGRMQQIGQRVDDDRREAVHALATASAATR